MTKPDDIPQDVWDAARGALALMSAYERAQHGALISRALLDARNAALEEAAEVAGGWPTSAAGDDYQTCGNGNFWDAGTMYDQGRIDAAAAIRARIEVKE